MEKQPRLSKRGTLREQRFKSCEARPEKPARYGGCEAGIGAYGRELEKTRGYFWRTQSRKQNRARNGPTPAHQGSSLHQLQSSPSGPDPLRGQQWDHCGGPGNSLQSFPNMPRLQGRSRRMQRPWHRSHSKLSLPSAHLHGLSKVQSRVCHNPHPSPFQGNTEGGTWSASLQTHRCFIPNPKQV